MGLGPLDDIARLSGVPYILLQDFYLLNVTATGGILLCTVVVSFPVTVSSRVVPASLGKRDPFFEWEQVKWSKIS